VFSPISGFGDVAGEGLNRLEINAIDFFEPSKQSPALPILPADDTSMNALNPLYGSTRLLT